MKISRYTVLLALTSAIALQSFMVMRVKKAPSKTRSFYDAFNWFLLLASLGGAGFAGYKLLGKGRQDQLAQSLKNFTSGITVE